MTFPKNLNLLGFMKSIDRDPKTIYIETFFFNAQLIFGYTVICFYIVISNNIY